MSQWTAYMAFVFSGGKLKEAHASAFGATMQDPTFPSECY